MSKEVIKIEEPPAYLAEMAEQDQSSLTNLVEHQTVPRLAIVQDLTPDEKKEAGGGIGSVWLPLANARVCSVEGAFSGIVVFFFTEYLTWRDRKDTSAHGIMAKTKDPTSEIATKAKDLARRREKYNDGTFEMRHVECKNFVLLVTECPENPETVGTLASLSYERGDARVGSQFVNRIMMRKVGGKRAPLYTTRWKFSLGRRNGPDGSWWGIDFAPIGWVDENDAKAAQECYEELVKIYAEDRLDVGHEGADEQEVAKVDVSDTAEM